MRQVRLNGVFVYWVFYCLCTIPVYGQADITKEYKFQNLDLELNSNRVEAIGQDSYGYIWIGTLAGLHKFDGVNLTEYLYADDSRSINASRIFKVFEDSKQRFWVTTENGLYQYQRPTDDFKRYWSDHPDIAKGEFQNRIWDITESSDGRVWMSGTQSGVQYLDESTDKFRSIQESDHQNDLLARPIIRCIAEKEPGLFLAGTDSAGIVEIDVRSGQNRKLTGSKALSLLIEGVEVHRMLMDSKGRLWASLADNGLICIPDMSDLANFEHYAHDPADPHSLFNNRVDCIFEDDKKNIWIGNQNGGLHLFDPQTNSFTRFQPDPSKPYSISSMAVRTMFQDNQGRLWVGSHLNGIDVYDKYLHKFDHYYPSPLFNSISGNIVNSFYEDHDSNLWIVVDGGGLNFFDRKDESFKVFMEDDLVPNQITSNAALTIESDKNEQLWVGTWRGGINVFNPSTEKFSTPFAHIQGLRDIYHIYRDKQGNMWVGAYEHGLTVIDPTGQVLARHQRDHKSEMNLGEDNILDFYQDHDGVMWIATEFNGLRKTTGDNPINLKLKSYLYSSEDSTSLANACVNHIHQDAKKRMWFATEGGLSLFIQETENFENFGSAHGFASNNIRSIAEDDRGNLWLGTAKSLTCFNPDTRYVRNYTKADGLQAGAFNKYSVLKLKSGEMVFGGADGFNIFHPDSLFDNPKSPQVQLIGLKVFNEQAEIGAQNSPLVVDLGHTEELVLDYSHSVFSIGYVGINFTQSDHNQYAYRMLNFDDQWNIVGSKREATYTNLDPGNYVFQVKAANNDGLWGDEPVSLSIKVLPPWWATTYFRLALLILMVLIVLAIIRYRTISLVRQRKHLERLVDERTQEVKKLNQDLTISEKMASLGIFTAGIAHEINNPINFISGATQKLFDLYELKLQSEKGKKTQEEAEIFEKLKGIIKIGIDRTTDIISSLRNYARNEQSKFERYNVTQCCEDSLTILSHKLNLGQIQLTKDYPDEVLIDCVPGKIGQVFVNLLSNAVDALEGKGEIHLSIQPYGDHVKIGIKDNGKGISDDEISKLFDPFYSTKGVGKGTGLGLYIVYGIINEHDGAIDVSSDKEGTLFSINLPVTHSQRVIQGA